MKVILYVAGGLVALVLLVSGIGALLPVAHTASRTAVFVTPPEVVWSAISDFSSTPQWRTDVQRMVRVPDAGGRVLWKEVGSRGTTLYEIEVAEAPRRLVTRIADEGLPYGGSWEYRLTERGDGTVLTITENGEVYNPLFRFVSRFLIGHHATLDAYVDALNRRLEAPDTPAPSGGGRVP